MCLTTSLTDEEYDSVKLVNKYVVASALDVSLRTVEGWVNGRKGGPPFIRVGRLVKWPLSNLRQYIKSRLEEKKTRRDIQRRRRCTGK